jgi:hypothetical protein
MLPFTARWRFPWSHHEQASGLFLVSEPGSFVESAKALPSDINSTDTVLSNSSHPFSGGGEGNSRLIIRLSIISKTWPKSPDRCQNRQVNLFFLIPATRQDPGRSAPEVHLQCPRDKIWRNKSQSRPRDIEDLAVGRYAVPWQTLVNRRRKAIQDIWPEVILLSPTFSDSISCVTWSPGINSPSPSGHCSPTCSPHVWLHVPQIESTGYRLKSTS